jgi:hypothetical protein
MDAGTRANTIIASRTSLGVDHHDLAAIDQSLVDQEF